MRRMQRIKELEALEADLMEKTAQMKYLTAMRDALENRKVALKRSVDLATQLAEGDPVIRTSLLSTLRAIIADGQSPG